MPIPDYESCMLPLLEYAKDGVTHKFRDACDDLAKHFQVSDTELSQMLPSGRYPVFRSRVGWAKTYLTKACLLEMPMRGVFRITPRGLQLLGQSIQKIDSQLLMRYPEFQAFQSNNGTNGTGANTQVPIATAQVQISKTPEEVIETAHLELRKTLAQELLTQVMQASPDFFEYLVVDLLVAMGYGGSQRDAAQVVGKSGDGGIDGTIKEDRLGLSTIYIQAKRWNIDKVISRPDIQKFVGALQGQFAMKGVFITTAKFADTARQFVKNLNCKVILIDGEQLAELMMDHNVGVSTKNVYEVKRIDTDYFSEE